MIDIDILFVIIGGLMSTLVVIIGWIGNKIHERLGEINDTLSAIDRDLRHELSRLDTRLSVVETKIKLKNHEEN